MQYYFHIRTGDAWIPDEEGLEFSDLCGARDELRASATDLVEAALRDRTDLNGSIIELEDEHGNVVETLPIFNVLH